MEEKKIHKEKTKGKYREKCGDCYYNGTCPLPLNQCMFLKKRKMQ